MPSSPRARPVLTARAMALSALVVLLVVVLASPVQRYLASRSDISRTASQLREHRAELVRLERQKALWADPGYVEQQARAKLYYAMPGDTVYVVSSSDQKNEIELTRAGPSTAAAHPGWNGRLWDSLRRADR